METLIIGQIDVLSQPFLDQLSRQTDLVLSADRPVSNFTGTKIKQYTHAVQDDSFLNLFSAYSFDAVLFFCGQARKPVQRFLRNRRFGTGAERLCPKTNQKSDRRLFYLRIQKKGRQLGGVDHHSRS